MSHLGWIAAARGDDAGAQPLYEWAIAADPTYPHVYRRFADLYYDRQDWVRALDYYRQVLTVLPRYFDVLVQAGNSARFLGDVEGAAAHYAAAAAAQPASWIPPYNLTCLRAVHGDREAALTTLGEALDRGFASPPLLAENDHFDGLRSAPQWPELVARTQMAARAAHDRRPAAVQK